VLVDQGFLGAQGITVLILFLIQRLQLAAAAAVEGKAQMPLRGKMEVQAVEPVEKLLVRV
jgi:hypothetical protein